MLAVVALSFSFASFISSPPALPCDVPVKAAVSFVADSDPLAVAAVEEGLTRGCFDVVEVRTGSNDAMLRAATDAGTPWLLVVRAGLVEALQDRVQGTLFSVDITAFETSSATRRGRAMRSANLLGHAQRATSSREAVRIVDDAVRVLRIQILDPGTPVQETPPPRSVDVECKTKTPLVVLWSKNTTDAAKAVVLHALQQRCYEAPDQFDADRRGAMEFARDLKHPLLAFKAEAKKSTQPGVVSHVMQFSADIVDANADELKVLKHAGETRNALNATDDVDAWAKVDSLVSMVLDKVFEKTPATPTPPPQ